jgi:DNA primase
MSVWDDIKDRLTVDEVLSDYIRLTSAGSNYRANCPFHNEKTPSLIISPSKGIWHCFGCGMGGDIFSFVSNIENLTKQETLTLLAKKAGYTLPKLSKNEYTNTQIKDENGNELPQTSKTELEKGHELLSWAKDIYHKLLLKILEDRMHPITQYCLKRNLDYKTIINFEIGYAPKNNALINLSKKYNISKDLLLKVGLIKTIDEKNSDKFVDRLMIPIFDSNSKVVGFTGRILDYDKSERPKYLNSPQSQWFNKSEIWFGLNKAKGSILRSSRAIIVEGNMDVIMASQFGLDNVIASQGTSFTSTQLSKLKKITKELVIAFDNDNAGKIGAKKLYFEASKVGFEVKILVIPENFKDLDEFLNSKSLNQDKQTIEQLTIIPYSDYLIEIEKPNYRNQTSSIQQKSIIDLLSLTSVMDALTKEIYIKKISTVTGISLTTLQEVATSIKKEPIENNFDLNSADGIDSEKNDSKPIIKVMYPELANAFVIFASYYKLFDREKKEYFKTMYQFLSPILDFDNLYEDVNSFLETKKDEFELINSQISYDYQKLQKDLIFQIDRVISKVFLSADQIEKYLEIKRG